MEVNDGAIEPESTCKSVEKALNTSHILLKIIEYSKEQKRDELFIVGTRTRKGHFRSFLDLRLVNKTFNEVVRMAVRREFRRVRIDIDDYFISCNHFMIEKHRVPPRRRIIDRVPRPANPAAARALAERAVNAALRVVNDAAEQNNPNRIPQQRAPPHVIEEAVARMAQRLPQPHNDEDMEDDDFEDEDGDESMDDADDDEEDEDSGSDSDRENVDQEMEEQERRIRPARLEPYSGDMIDVRYIEKFLRWLEDTFNPTVECLKMYDCWTFKPCSVPNNWLQLQRFRSFHPDMDDCICNRCIRIVRNCHTFGPISFELADHALKFRSQTFKSLSCKDSFLADIAIEYTVLDNGTHRFDANRFENEFKNLRVNELLLAVQAIPDVEYESPGAVPLEVIQLLIKLWEVKTIHFELVKVLDTNFYNQRRSWESTGVFHLAYLIAYRTDAFDEPRHVVPYRQTGPLDAYVREEIVPIFDLRIDLAEQTRRMSSSLSLLSLASRENVEDTGYPLNWPYQGRIVFNMFRANHVAFVHSGNPEFHGVVGMVNWLKYIIRGMMRWTWGGRGQAQNESNKNVYWIFFIEEGSNMRDIWYSHMGPLLSANYSRLEVTIDNGENFKKCPNRRVLNYDCITRPDVLESPRQSYYVTLYDRLRNNRTHFKFIKVCL